MSNVGICPGLLELSNKAIPSSNFVLYSKEGCWTEHVLLFTRVTMSERNVRSEKTRT